MKPILKLFVFALCQIILAILVLSICMAIDFALPWLVMDILFSLPVSILGAFLCARVSRKFGMNEFLGFWLYLGTFLVMLAILPMVAPL